MRILVIGGSNSLLKGGYVHGLAQALQGHVEAEIIQVSVGATTSLAAIGRLHETFTGAPVDVILYEYGINDAGHFAPRPGGAESWLMCFHLLLKTAAQLYPAAMFVPLLLAQQAHFPATVPLPFYDAQLAAYRELGLDVIDVRAWLSALFLGRAPDWMYMDPAHYAAPHATSIIGALVARHLLKLRQQPVPPLSAALERLLAHSPYATLEAMYVRAPNLQQFCSGPVQRIQSGNRLMQLDCLRMLPGSRLQLNSAAFPLALFLKSDRGHQCLQLELSTPEGMQFNACVATRHADTETLPFIYSNIPLPLLWGNSLLMHYGASQLTLSVPAQQAGPLAGFDCYLPGQAGAANHLDLVGLLMLVQP